MYDRYFSQLKDIYPLTEERRYSVQGTIFPDPDAEDYHIVYDPAFQASQVVDQADVSVNLEEAYSVSTEEDEPSFLEEPDFADSSAGARVPGTQPNFDLQHNLFEEPSTSTGILADSLEELVQLNTDLSVSRKSKHIPRHCYQP